MTYSYNDIISQKHKNRNPFVSELRFMFGKERGIRAWREDSLALRLTSKLADLRVANANPIRSQARGDGFDPAGSNTAATLRGGGCVGTRNGNRTHNYPLGGGYYIHLTMQAYCSIVSQVREKIKGAGKIYGDK